jgi:invasion protein IalB
VACNLWEIIALKNVFTIASAGGALVIGLSLSGAAAESPARTETTAAAKPTKQVIGDWVVSCALTANGHTTCVMSHI